MIVNLLEETEQVMAAYNQTWDDVEWIGGHTFYIDTASFIDAARETDYNNEFGTQEVAYDLIICFTNKSWMTRSEYDGSEGWEYHICPHKPQEKFEGELKLAGGAWDSLKSINSPENYYDD